MTTWLIPMSSQDQVKSLKSQDPLSLSSCRSQKYIVFLRYIRGGGGVRRYVTNVTFIFFLFFKASLRSSFIVKNNHRLWCGGTRRGRGKLRDNMSRPVSDVWLLGWSGTNRDRRGQYGHYSQARTGGRAMWATD